MKYLLLLGFLGVANAYDALCTTAKLTAGISGKCSHSLYKQSGEDIYICTISNLFTGTSTSDDCPIGWAVTVENVQSNSIGTGHCYLKAASIDHTDVDTICADPTGDFCPAGQSPSDGECVSVTTPDTSCDAGQGGDPCTACSAGQFSSSGVCETCGDNKYQDEAGQAACETCDGPNAEPSTDKTGCQCIGGYGGSPCTECIAGKFSSGGADCTPCTSGYQDVAGQNACKVCAGEEVATLDKQGCIGISKEWLEAEYKKIVEC